MTPTSEQTHILDLVTKTDSNLMINALAGTGKTATLKMIEAIAPTKPILVLAFNKKIAEDASKTMVSTNTVRTFNSLGHRIWAAAIGRNFKPDPRKTADLYRTMISETTRPQQKLMWEAFWPVVEGVAQAKSLGYIPPQHSLAKRSLASWPQVAAAMDETPDAFIHRQIDATLLRSIALAYAGTCDFNDQVYMPTLFTGSFPEFPLVMVDEYQDLNPINHHMIAKLTRHRIIGVGDPHQSIYEFRGAKPAGMAHAVATYTMTECDLSTSFRCPEAIVHSVHWHVPNFRWIKPGGIVCDLSSLDIREVPEGVTFICRNNAPLFALAMRCLSSGISVNVSGSDIGPRLIRQMKKLGPEDLPRDSLLPAIAEWLAAKKDRGSKTAADAAACMRVFADHGENLGQALRYAEHLFAQTAGKLHFITGHKSKGLEYPHVVHLDPFLLGDNEQEKNLSYVISTRASEQLYSVNSNNVRIQC